MDRKPATYRFLMVLFILLALFQIVVYRNTFQVEPSGDDFIAPLAEIYRGNTQGVSVFFTECIQGDYRPLQSLVMWIFGNISSDNTLLWVHLLHFLSAWLYFLTGFLWIFEFRFSRLNSLIAGLVMFFHPVLAGNIASPDCFGRFAVSFWIWLGVFLVYKIINRSFAKALFMAAGCLIIGLGFMEYAISLIPLSGITAYLVSKEKKLRNALIMIATMSLIFFVYFLVRYYLIESSKPGVAFISRDVSVWPGNFAMLYGALLFFGNTVWVMIHKSIVSFSWFGLNFLIVALMLFYGMRLEFKRIFNLPNSAEQCRNLSYMIWLFFISSIPLVFLRHVTELYICSMVIPAALLMGKAFSVWVETKKITASLAIAFFLFQLALSVHAVNSKVNDLVEMGERTKNQTSQIIKHIPEDASDMKIALLFDEDALSSQPEYSIFKSRDSNLILRLARKWFVMNWYMPGKDHSLLFIDTKNTSMMTLDSCDIVLIWDFESQRFHEHETDMIN